VSILPPNCSTRVERQQRSSGYNTPIDNMKNRPPIISVLIKLGSALLIAFLFLAYQMYAMLFRNDYKPISLDTAKLNDKCPTGYIQVYKKQENYMKKLSKVNIDRQAKSQS
jgi:hypothetical protein